jgi:8-oxo-dGTP pyrophosphatase MutT (NUDIX family)
MFLRARQYGDFFRLSFAENKRFAGFLFVCFEDGTIFLAKRADEPVGTWEGLGGHLDAGETEKEAARRETIEEGGSMPKINGIIKTVVSKTENGGTYTLYIAELTSKEKEKWKPVLNHEHSHAAWFSKLPDDTHPALIKELKSLL